MKALLLATSLLLVSFNVNAVVLNETTDPEISAWFIDTGATHYDTTTGLSWLNFSELINGVETDLTLGQSVNSAEAWFEPQGFRVATETEVTELFYSFFPTYVDNGSGYMEVAEDPSADLITARNSWLFSFGSYIDDVNHTMSSVGFYEDDAGFIQELGVNIDLNPLNTLLLGEEYSEYTTGFDEAYLNRGVFMVMDATVVPIPAAVWLFGTGLLGLVAVARRKHK